MKEYLVLSGIGPDKPGIAKAISEAAYTSGCSIEDSRMAVLGGEFAILVLLEGEKHAVEDFSGRIKELEKQTGLTLALRSTKSQPDYYVKEALPYRIMVVGMDRTGIVFRVTELLARHGINIENLETEAHNAPLSGTPMFRMIINAKVPARVQVRKLREELASLCDELNMDYTFEARG